MWRADDERSESAGSPLPASPRDLRLSSASPPEPTPPMYPPSSGIPGAYPETSLMPNARLWPLRGRMAWSFVWLNLWTGLTTAVGRLVVRDILEDYPTYASGNDPLFVCAFLLGSAILCLPLAVGVAEMDTASSAIFTVFFAYFGSMVVPPVGILALQSLVRTVVTPLQAFAVGVAGWFMCTFAFLLFTMFLSIVSVCFAHDSPLLF
ncbi:hypothetical protein L227DRAFT_658700 [Lentinus tigrinus ALCF2SS1-6]|uniref:Uncharacterized protein n=1 Tax=Lentinus tigrinus ALCF2SS1-6 TaxID=1328759 RepID=A0A5C2RR64_9APHY|nr:hypothetical protein L227DRAFT_658700 [Lentinus tigrinus ALCF2SS1-6]